ncbi:PTS sugar transporter subunit IIA [Clostridium butyricum]|uniref:PTS sugar transporter subunit IIA n=1 Tax=Clostridium butyricum TaxID=1492 RepID=UPI002ABD2EED|nr:PTS glucose transporter subunit IIA [Clostridium butyricum]
MFGFGKKKEIKAKEFNAVISGKSIDLSEVKDDMFSSRALGKGMAVIPTSDEIVSPCNGKVVMVAETKHAIAIENDEGIQVLIHIGLDTVNLNGKGFEVFCKAGDEVKNGKVIAKVDRDFLRKENISDVIMMVVVEPNGRNIIECNNKQDVQAGSSVLIKYE